MIMLVKELPTMMSSYDVKVNMINKSHSNGVHIFLKKSKRGYLKIIKYFSSNN
jgi:hypothetical protein